MRRVLHWLVDYWFVPVLVGAGIIGWIFGQKLLGASGINPLELARAELTAIEAKREARDLRLQLGAEKATQAVKAKYRAQRAALDRAGLAEVAKLEGDPEALALFLARITE